MRATLTALLLLALTACRISGLGNCSSDADCSPGAACDLAQRVCVPTDAPAFSNIAVSTGAGYTDPNGRAFFDTGGSPLSVSASISGRAGVDPTTVCLRVAGESGACLHPGTAGSGNQFTFELPRPSGSFDGTTPLDFTISATSPTGRAATSAVQHVYFDNQPPAIAVAADPTPYARSLPDGGAAPIAISVTIADATGVVSPHLLSGSNALAPAGVNGSVYTFELDPAGAPAGAEGPYTFNVRATDGLGHQSVVAATRTIDGAPPTLALIKIYKGDAEPADAGVTYPALAANTGWTGSTFIYNDVVHVKGRFSDISGISSATLRVDGIEFDGGTSTGTAQSLGCSSSSSTCAFDVTVELNDVHNGAFHTGVATASLPDGGAQIPSGMLHFILEAHDKAVAYGGTAASRAITPSDTQVRATRLLWSRVLNTSAAAVTGLAVHPDLDLVATTDGGVTTLYSVAADQGTIRWSTDAGTVLGPPAIGNGGADAPIYTSNLAGVISAFAPDGGVLWTAATGPHVISVGPAVAAATVGGVPVDQVVVADNVSLSGSSLWSVTAPANIPALQSQAADDRDRHASPMVFDGGVWFGTSSSVDWHPLTEDGGIGPSVAISGSIGNPYYGTITDGTNVFAASRSSLTVSTLSAFTPLLDTAWSKSLTDGGLSAEPTLGIDGKLYASDDAGVTVYEPGDGGTPGMLVSGLAAPPGFIALHGSDDHWYLPSGSSTNFRLTALQAGQTSWTFAVSNRILRGAMIDCNGRMFVGGGASLPTIWAFVTDDQGLADTPWPSWRRDARNTGNAGAPKYGIRTPPNTCNQ